MSDRFLGRYRLLQRLGVGGWAEVWSALDEQTGDRVALKRLHPHVARDVAARARLRREAAALAALDHPGIVDVLDVIESDDEAALVLEFIDGEPLSETIGREGRLSPEHAIRLIGQVAGALATAHAAGILHRDVKPANVLVDRGGDAHLTDFGIARSSDASSSVTATGDVVGTLRYLAPEVLRGEPPTPAADVWALGALAYVLLEGKPPYAGAVPAELVAAYETAPPVPKRGGAAVGRLIAASLSPKPSDRPVDGGAFAAALAAATARGSKPGAVAAPAIADATVVMPAVGDRGGAPESPAASGAPPRPMDTGPGSEPASAVEPPPPVATVPIAPARPARRTRPAAGRPLRVPAPLVAAGVAVLIVGILAAGRQPEPSGGRDDTVASIAPSPTVTVAPTEPPKDDKKGNGNGKKNDPPGHDDDGDD